MPDFLDVAEIGSEGGGERHPRKPGRDAGRAAPGGKLRQRQANRSLRTVEPSGKQARRCRPRAAGKRRQSLGERGRVGRGTVLGPDERHRLHRIADEIMREPQKLVIDALRCERAKGRRPDAGRVEAAGEGGKRPPPVRVRCPLQIVGH